MAGYKREIRPGIWRLEYQLDGEKYSKNVKANTINQADKFLSLFISEIEKGTYHKSSSMTFVELAQLFLDKYANDNLSPTTVDDYKHRLNKYILEKFGTMKIDKIKRLHVQEFANDLVKEYNLSSKTASNYIKLISSILNKAIEWDLLLYNVADKVSIPKNLEKNRKKVVLYSYEEIQAFLKALNTCDDMEFKMAVYSSFVLGGRRSEILGIDTNDINIEKLYIDIQESLIRVKGGVQRKGTKTGKERRVYVPKTYMEMLADYINHYLGNPTKNVPLFNMHPDTYSKKFKNFLIDNNLREINLKDLRALNESILVNQGIDIVAAAKRLGHLPSTATNFYLDQIPEEDKKASEILQNLL